MKTMKKALAVLLATLILITMIPFEVFAQEPDESASAESEYEFDTSNALGQAISELADESESDDNTAYSISWIEMEGNVATVEFSCLTDCDLVVAVYEENGQMVASGNMEVTPEMNSIEVWVEIDEMPEFFVVKAFLLDSEMGALCDEFSCDHYTEAYREFFEITVDEFDDDLVMNLDEADDNNFFVVADTAIVAYPSKNINILTDADDENYIYTFANPSEEICSLVVGDIFFYDTDDENFVLLKVKEIACSDGVAVITGDPKTSFEELFSFIKLDFTDVASESSMDTETMDPDLDYYGEELVTPEPQARTFALRENASAEAKVKKKFNFGIDKTFGSGTKKFSVAADIGVTFSVDFRCYYTRTRWLKIPTGIREIYFGATTKLEYSLSVEASFDATKNLPMGFFEISFLGIVGVRGSINFVLKASGSISISGYTSRTTGFNYIHKKGVKSIDSKQQRLDNPEIEIALSISVGFDVNFSLTVLTVVFTSGLGMQAGIRLDIAGSAPLLAFEDGDPVLHDCDLCFDINLYVYVKAYFNGAVFGIEVFNITIASAEYPIFKKYWSIRSGRESEFLNGKCPHFKYKIAVDVTKQNGDPLPNASIFIDGNTITTNASGKAHTYLEKGDYALSCFSDNFSSQSKNIEVTESGASASFVMRSTKIKNITVSQSPVSKDYYVGDSFSTNGMQLLITYYDGRTSTVSSGYNILPTKFTTGGQQNVTVRYSGLTCEIPVYVNSVADISFENQPSYYPGDKLFKDDLKINITFEDGTIKTLNVNSSLLQWSKTSFETGGTHSINVTYYDKTLNFDIYVNPVTDISFVNIPSYYPGDSLFKDDLKVNISFADGTNKEMKANSSLLSWTQTSFETGGTHTISVTYCDTTQIYDIYVNPITDISFTDLPSYYPGDNLHKAEFKVQITFADNTAKMLSSKDALLHIADFTYTTGGTHEVTVTYCDKTQTTAVYVNPITDIVFDNIPEYFVGDNVNKENLAVRIVFEDNTEKILQGNNSLLHYSVLSFSEKGEQDITVTYYDKSTVLTIDVLPVIPVAIEVSYLPEKSVYVIGEQFDPTGMKIKVQYNNGTTATLDSGFTCTAAFTETGLQSVLISHEDVTCVLDVFVWETAVTPTYNASSRYYKGYMDSATGIMYMWGFGSPYYSGSTVINSLVIGEGFTSIGTNAFDKCSGIKSITIPDSVASIGKKEYSSLDGINGAFWGCTALENISFGENSLLTYIGTFTFYDCTSLASITIPDSVTSIGDEAFAHCDSLASITIPDSVTSIGDSAFYDCDSLASVTFGNNSQLKSIGELAFYYCDSLASITIPDSVTSIGYSAFSSCDSLASVDFGENSQLTSIGDDAFSYCDSLASITLPGSVTSIGNSAFSWCTSLASITIPDSVTSIEEEAFLLCTSLASVYFSGNATVWCNISFGDADSNPLNCTADLYLNGEPATDIIVPDGVTEILYQFQGCTNLVNITIPDSVTSIGDDAFRGCESLASITIPDSVTSIGDYAFHNCDSLASITIPDSVTSIGDYAFSSCDSLASITFGDNSQLKSIGSSAFSHCTSLAAITIPDSVTSIGDRAFYYCTSLASVDFGDNSQLHTIGKSAFSGSSIASITLPDSVTSIGERAFYSCTRLASVYFGGNVTAWCNITFGNAESNPLYYTADLYLNGVPATDIIIPDGVTEILYQFRGCTNLVNITIPDSVTSIGNSAFSSCASLASITIPDSVTSIGDSAFYSCTRLENVYFGGDATTWCNIVFTNELSSPLYYTADLHLNGIPATDIVVPDGVTEILYQFRGCTNLINITIPDSVTSIGERAFYNCTNLANVDFGDYSQLQSIGNYAFYSCDNLANITFYKNSNLTSIGAYGFAYCTKLEIAELPDSLSKIGENAFLGCTFLKKVTISTSVEEIGTDAFKNCNSGLVIYYGGSKEEFKEINGDSVPENATISENYQPTAFSVYTVSHDGAIVGNRYTMIAIKKSANGYNYDNLMYIAVKTADSSVITFNYIPKMQFGYDVLVIGEFENSSDIPAIETKNDSGSDGVRVQSVSVEPAQLSLIIGQDGAQLTTSITPANATLQDVKWKSATPSVAYVDENGYVEAISPGTATITVTTLDGNYTATCEVSVIIEPCTGNHIWNRGRVKKSPTCTETGEKVYTCTVCGTTKTEVIAPSNHTWDDGIETNAPTCTESGERLYTCTTCNTTKTETVDASGHTWDSGTIVTAPTCTEKGVVTYTCINNASHTYTEDIDELNHTAGVAVMEDKIEATCTVDGSYNIVVYCATCGDQLSTTAYTISALGHTPGADATCSENQTCSVCGDILTEKLDHDYHAIITAPTCTAEGFTTYTCSACGDSYVGDYVNAAGHTEEVIPGKAATCTATGLTDGKKCTVCGETTLAQTVLAKKEHSKTTINQIPATATEDGYTGDVICSVCDELLAEGKVIPATGEQNNCSHMCHQSGFMGFIWKIFKIFWKLFGMNPVCECGAAHY